jgi:hypothetical protein
VLRKYFLFTVFLVIASIVCAQGPAERPEPADFLRGATGDKSQLDSPLKYGDGALKGKPHNDGTAQSTKSAGVVIFSSNTGGDEEFFCKDLDEPFLYYEAEDFWVQSAVIQSVVFKPSPKHPDFLEIIWSGQVNISTAPSPDFGIFDQQVYLRCTVTQKDRSVPCSGTSWDPSIAQDVTGDGLTQWVWYHGYVEMDSKHEVKVEIQLFATNATTANGCEDTLILKY